MNWQNKRTPLLLAVLPFLAILLSLGPRVGGSVKDYWRNKDMQSHVVLYDAVGEALESVQGENVASMLYVRKRVSLGDLDKAQKRTDENIIAVEQALTESELPDLVVDDVLDALARLPEIRYSIEEGYYNSEGRGPFQEIVQELFDACQSAAHITTDPEMGACMGNVLVSLGLQDYMGQLRQTLIHAEMDNSFKLPNIATIDDYFAKRQKQLGSVAQDRLNELSQSEFWAHLGEVLVGKSASGESFDVTTKIISKLELIQEAERQRLRDLMANHSLFVRNQSIKAGAYSLILAGALVSLIYLMQMARRLAEGSSRLQVDKKCCEPRRCHDDALDNQQGMIFRFRMCEGDYIHTFCRGKLARWIGWDPEWIEGKKLHEVFEGEAAKRWRLAYDVAWGGKSIAYEDQVANGDLFYRVYLEPIKQFEKVIEVSAYAVDITDLKQTERDLARAKEGLELKNEDLQQLNFQLERAIDGANIIAQNAQLGSVEKSGFLAKMSHEIRTPLNAILGMTSLLEETKLDEEQKDFLDTIYSSGNSLLDVIDDVLDFSKIEAGFLKLEAVEFEVIDCLDEMIGLFGLRLREKHLNFYCEIEPNVPEYIIGDPIRLRQVLVNLIGNSVKFTSEGSIYVKVSFVQHLEGEGTLLVSVKDTGIGISEEMKNSVFSEFSQGDDSMTRKYGGTGLGLSISKRLCEIMGGDIVVESAGLGKGAEFTFSITVNFVAKKHSDELSVLDGKCALVLSRKEAHVDFLSAVLGVKGVKVLPANSLKKAKALLMKGVDFIVVDGFGDEQDPERLANELVLKSSGEKLPILYLTSLSTQLYSELKLSRPHLACLLLPFKHSVLYSTIARLFEVKIASHGSSDLERDMLALHDLKQQLKGKTVLVAEDDQSNQKVIRLLLQKVGVNPRVVGDGEDVIDALRGSEYDFLLMDVHMPKMSGLEATQRIRREFPKDKQPYIIATTASVTLSERDSFLKGGMDAFLSKPLRMQEFVQVLKESEQVLN